MTDNIENKEKEITTEEQPVSLAPYVNEKLKYFLIAFIIMLCVVTALLVFFSPEAREARENKSEETIETSQLYIESINT